ncbi:MAG: superoxide dismutase [Euryarchaeota archaeon]|nr:superoxide dismutase [Euryarchaeota archaeon]
MEQTKRYELPKLAYGYKDLAPFLSEEQLTVHHTKHHAAYVNAANAILDRMARARAENADIDAKGTLKDLSFQIGGHYLHSVYWETLCPAGKGGEPQGKLKVELEKEFGSIERFKREFSAAAGSAEGSGWAVLVYCMALKKPIIMQVEKHNVNVIPGFRVLMSLDVWEHAYYIDYKNLRPKYIEAFWNQVDWAEVGKKLDAMLR